MNILYDLISTGRPQVLSHCSVADWNLNFIHRLVYIRPVMYSNRTVQSTSLLYVSAYLTQTYTIVAIFPIIFPISIEITEPTRTEFEKRKFVDFVRSFFLPFRENVNDDTGPYTPCNNSSIKRTTMFRARNYASLIKAITDVPTFRKS